MRLHLFQSARLVLAALLFCIAGALQAADPPERLLRLVGADVAVCIEAANLQGNWRTLENSEVIRRLEATRFYREWRDGPAYRKLQQGRLAVERQTGRPFREFAADMFGRAVVLALYSSAADEDMKGVFLTQTVGPEMLQAALDAWNREPDVTRQPLDHSATRYFRRVRPPKGNRPSETLFYVALDDVLALSDSEPLIRRVIELDATIASPEASGADSLAHSPSYLAARKALPAETALALYLNPRAFDERLARKAEQSPADRLFAQLWRQVEGMACGLRWDEGVAAELVLNLNSDQPSPGWRKFVGQVSGPPTFFEHVPADALAAYAGRHDLAGLARLALSFVPEKKLEQSQAFRQVSRGLLLGRDLFDDVLPHLGANWGGYVMGRAELKPDVPPVDALLAIELPPDDVAADGKPPLRSALENGLNTGLNLLAAFHNAESPDAAAVVRTKTLNRSENDSKVTMRQIEGLGSLQPAYALTDRHVLFATAGRLIEESVSLESGQSLASMPQFRRWQQRHFAEQNQVFLVNLTAVREFLNEGREFFVAEIARNDNVTPEEAAKRFEALVEVLSIVDGAFIALRFDEDRIRLIVGGAIAHRAEDRRRESD